MIRRPPQHAATGGGQYITGSDDAWDADRIEAERKAIAADAEKAGSKPADHPIDAYFRGSTRYDLDAPATIGGLTVTVRQYLKPGSTPTVFQLRREGLGLRRAQALAVAEDPAAWTAAMWGLAQHGVAAVTEGFEGAPWPLRGGGAGQPLTAADMQALYEAGAGLPDALGSAVFRYAAPLSDAEGKP